MEACTADRQIQTVVTSLHDPYAPFQDGVTKTGTAVAFSSVTDVTPGRSGSVFRLLRNAMTTHTRRTLLLLLLTLAVGTALSAWLFRETLFANGGQEDAAQGRPPPAVETARVERATIADRIRATGTLQAPEAVTITARTAGRVDKIHFEEGQRVAKGALLVELERDRSEAAVERAAARLEQRSSAEARRKELMAKDFVSASEMDSAEAAAREAKAQLRIARKDLDDRRIEAPFAGVIGRRLISIGALLKPGDPIARLSRTQPLDLLFMVPGVEIGRIAPDQRVEATTPAYPSRRFDGALTLIGTEVDPGTRTLPLEATFDNPDGLLKPGMFMQVALIVGQRDTLRVPEAAVITEGPNTLVYALRPPAEDEKNSDAKVERRRVETGTRRDGWVEIRDGVAAGERVVVAGLQGLRDGLAVRPTSASKASDSGAPPAESTPPNESTEERR
ncbi:efflux transporter, RND family, MFP subunit [Thiorhodococcus drewsii AZ1]|uniref:Efflux transporter, RND family, MFP subunit n=2 Tax=Thiorhodococcus drewsii TaxID=210408 RepID=G2E2J3_9GAMM|nr:efflux transporter, RND family, MFP subunit [Thiorhodococcus drewsii AZ1]